MKVKEIIKTLDLQLVAGGKGLEVDITGGYVGDLLSFVISHAREGEVWITVQGHINVLAVAVMVGVSAVILAEGVKADEAMKERADLEGIPLFEAKASSFKLVSSLTTLLQGEG